MDGIDASTAASPAAGPSTGPVTRRATAASSASANASTNHGKAPRFKVKMSKGGETSAAPKNAAYMHGYNRELDSSDDERGEGLSFEEQLIFRMPAGKDCDRLRDMVKNRQVGENGAPEVSLEFKDSRRAVFKLGSSRFAAKLVDLPTLTESHKILDNKQMFKVADISQMLLVEERLRDDDASIPGDGSADGASRADILGGGEKSFDIEDFIYPHGITPPMHWARKRRFRKRANKRNIETVEKEVEKLLEEDEMAEKVEYEIIDESALDHLSDSEMGDNAASTTAATPRPMSEDGDSQAGDAQHAARRTQDGAGDDDDVEEDDVDEDLAAALDAALEEAEEETDSEDGDGDGDGDGERDGAAADDEDDADEEEEDDDEDEEQAEQRIRVNQLEAECREIDTLVRKKQADVDRATNPVIKQRLDRNLKALQAELESKRAQLLALRQEREHRKEEAAQAEAETEEERNRQEEEKEKEALALAQAEEEAQAEAVAKAKAAAAVAASAASSDQANADGTGTSEAPHSASNLGSSRAPADAMIPARGEGFKAAPLGRVTSLKEVLIGEASGRGVGGRGSSPGQAMTLQAQQAQSQQLSGRLPTSGGPSSNAASPAAGASTPIRSAATTAVAMDVDEPGGAPGPPSNIEAASLSREPATTGQHQGVEDEEEGEDEDEEEDEDAGAAPNEDSDAEEGDDEGLWS